MNIRQWIAFLFMIGNVGHGAWTEQDESRRIAMIKQEESRAFEMQMRGHNPFVGGGASSNNGFYGSQNYYQNNYPNGMNPSYQSGHYSNYPDRSVHQPGSPVHKVPIESRPSYTSELRSAKSSAQSSPDTIEVKSKTWCFHCASPWNQINSDMQQAMRNLLEIRRARFPATSYVRADCSHPKNVSDLPKQECSIGYCETLVLTDHDSATALTIRGCAEKLGAVDERELDRREDNSCKKLHQTVDIRECICKNRKFCYSGSTKNYGYKEDDAASFRKCSLSSFSTANSAFLAILLTGLRFLLV